MIDLDWKIIAALGFTLALMALPIVHRKYYGQIPEIDAGKLLELLDNSKPLQIIDLRSSTVGQSAHSQGAVNLPCSVFQSCLDELLELQKDRDGETPLILVCGSDLTSIRLCRKLLDAGCENLFVLKGGFNYWKRKRLETVP